MGGVDWWAIEEAKRAGVDWREHPPKTMRWSGPDGYQARNLKIAEDSDLVVCISVAELPPHYTGMRFPQGCYHCKTSPEHHIKSGGCYTMWYARRIGKQVQLLVAR